MKITDIRAHVMGVAGPDGRTPRRNWVFVEVRTDAGLTGLGEATTEYHELAVGDACRFPAAALDALRASSDRYQANGRPARTVAGLPFDAHP